MRRITAYTTLCSIAQKYGIRIDTFRLASRNALSIVSDGNAYIALSPKLTDTEEKECLAHELGHCINGAFYNQYSSLDLREKAEYKANKWAYSRLLPVGYIKAQAKKGIVSAWEIAEETGLSVDFVQKAIEHYQQTGQLQVIS